jgi:hypothetical protein
MQEEGMNLLVDFIVPDDWTPDDLDRLIAAVAQAGRAVSAKSSPYLVTDVRVSITGALQAAPKV